MHLEVFNVETGVSVKLEQFFHPGKLRKLLQDGQSNISQFVTSSISWFSCMAALTLTCYQTMTRIAELRK